MNTGLPQSLGLVMLDIEGTRLGEHDRRRLLHPNAGGVILFSRNYESPPQIAELCAEIRALRDPHLLIAVDHEGGRVQRFREGFTRLPPMRALGRIHDRQPQHARHLAHEAGYVLASELRACGLDLSFTPVLDLDYGSSTVIGDRAFHASADVVGELAVALIEGLRQGGMAACGKHFPGHGFVAADSHTDLPIDRRSLAEIEKADLLPFRQLIRHGLSAIMPAHVIYPAVDSRPAGFSDIWLSQILRGQLGFRGVIFSDDLSMEAARATGTVVDRAEAAFAAGCDMVLVCNDPPAADQLLDGLTREASPVSQARLAQLRGGNRSATLADLRKSEPYLKAVHAIASIGQEGSDLPLVASTDKPEQHG